MAWWQTDREGVHVPASARAMTNHRHAAQEWPPNADDIQVDQVRAWTADCGRERINPVADRERSGRPAVERPGCHAMDWTRTRTDVAGGPIRPRDRWNWLRTPLAGSARAWRSARAQGFDLGQEGTDALLQVGPGMRHTRQVEEARAVLTREAKRIRPLVHAWLADGLSLRPADRADRHSHEFGEGTHGPAALTQQLVQVIPERRLGAGSHSVSIVPPGIPCTECQSTFSGDHA